MREYLDLAIQMYKNYTGIGWGIHIFLHAVCFFYLAFSAKTEGPGRYKKFFAVFSLIWLIIYICPFSTMIMVRYCIEQTVYWRLFWILPTTIVIAYTGTLIATQTKKKWLATVCAIALIAMAGYPMNDCFKADAAANEEKIPSFVVDMCELIEEDYRQRGIDEAKVIFPDEYLCYVRQYDADIKMPYGRNAIRSTKPSKLYTLMNTVPMDVKAFVKQAKKKNCNYLVYHINNVVDVKDELLDAGYIYVGENNDYLLFYLQDK